MSQPEIQSIDQALTGRFIQSLRKELGLTQRQLAEKLMKEREENVKKIKISVLAGVSATATLLVLILLVAFYAGVMPLPVKLVVIGFACAQFAVGLYVAVSLDRDAGYFKCKACGETFKPTFGAYMMGPHGITRRWLRCPKCGKVTACKHVMSKE